MTDLRQYLLSIIVMAVICGVITGIFKNKSTYGSIIQLLAGLAMLIVLISPVKNIKLSNMISFPDSFTEYAKEYTQQGIQESVRAKGDIIKAQTEAYILDKAASMNTIISVSVVVSEESIPKPIFVTLKGDASPYKKQVLENDIEKQLGIAKENQIWI